MGNMNDELQAEGNIALNFLGRPVPLGAAIVAAFVGLLIGWLL